MDKIEVGEVFTISGEEEQEQEVEVVGTIHLDGSDYVAVSFVEDLQQESEDDIDVFFLKVDQDDDLSPIESDEEFDKVSMAFEELMEAED